MNKFTAGHLDFAFNPKQTDQFTARHLDFAFITKQTDRTTRQLLKHSKVLITSCNETRMEEIADCVSRIYIKVVSL